MSKPKYLLVLAITTALVCTEGVLAREEGYAGFGYWLESPDSGPEGLRFRLQANFVLPR